VDAVTQVVDTETRQRLDSDTDDCERRHQAWLRQSGRPYTDPNPVIAPPDRSRTSWPRRRGNRPDPYQTRPQPPGPVRSM
jgi:hypothetical protein